MRKMIKQQELFETAKKCLVGGLTARQRYNEILGHPLYIDHADGCRLYDIDGNSYIDYHAGSGAALFGHNHPRIRAAIERAVERGFFMNYDTKETVEMAQLIKQLLPCCEKVRLANTGSEATLGAIRLARGYTGKNLVLKFEGHFHGMHESIWFNHDGIYEKNEIGEVVTTPDSVGFPAGAEKNVINVIFNDIDALEKVVAKYRGQIACLIMEPISFNCGCMESKEGFIKQVRDICTREDIVLIFDEVICGVGISPGSAQKRYGVYPDLTTTAKGIAGGLPISLIGGKKEIMDCLSPLGPVVTSGTYTGSFMSVMVSVECLKMALEPGFYEHIDSIGEALFTGVNDLFKKHGLQGHARGVSARWAIYFGVENPEDDYDFRKIAKTFDRDMDRTFSQKAMERGLWFHDTSTEIAPCHRALTTVHQMADINETLEKIDDIFSEMKSGK